MSDILSKNGDVELKVLTINSANGASVSIRPQCMVLDMYSNLFEKYMSGEVVVADAQNLQSLLPLVGNETIDICFETPSLNLSYKGWFYIYKMSEKYKLGREDVYCLYFISPEAIASTNRRISRTFRCNALNAVVSLFENDIQTEKAVRGDDSVNRFTYCSNYWTPTKNIDYILSRSVDEFGYPTFLFYETNLGFHFTSLNHLISDENGVVHNFIISEYEKGMGSGEGGVKSSVERDYMQVQEVAYRTGFDFSERVSGGYYGGTLITYDNITGRYTEKYIKIDIPKNLNKNGCVVGNAPVATNSLMVFAPKSYNNIDDSGDNTDSEYKILRNGIFSRLRNQQITIKVYGRTDYFVGQKVNLQVSNSGQSDEKQRWNKLLSGNYLITAVKHQVKKNFFFSYLELSKGSYIDEPEGESSTKSLQKNKT